MIRKYELSQEMYVPVIGENGKSYGGKQEWFSKRLPRSKKAWLHQYGCGVIAGADLFMYLTMTTPYKRECSAFKTLEKDGTLLKAHYMDFVEYVRESYIPIIPKVGVPNWVLIMAINSYLLLHQMPYKASLGYLVNETKLLTQIIKMIKKDLPVILLIGTPFPPILYKRVLKNKKIGVPFYERSESKHFNQEGEITYKVAHPPVTGHYVTVTGVIINKAAQDKRDKVMLKISSWGKLYYMSFYEYCQYEIKYGVDFQGSIVSLSAR